MVFYQFNKKIPIVDQSTYVFPSATLIGDVVVGKKCFIGPGVILRGDKNNITIGEETIMQEQVVVHTEEEFTTTIGNKVVVGAGSILHCERIEDDVMIGLGVILGMGAKIQTGAVIIDGSLIPQWKNIAAQTIVAGIPAKKIENEFGIEVKQQTPEVNLSGIYRTQLERIH